MVVLVCTCCLKERKKELFESLGRLIIWAGLSCAAETVSQILAKSALPEEYLSHNLDEHFLPSSWGTGATGQHWPHAALPAFSTLVIPWCLVQRRDVVCKGLFSKFWLAAAASRSFQFFPRCFLFSTHFLFFVHDIPDFWLIFSHSPQTRVDFVSASICFFIHSSSFCLVTGQWSYGSDLCSGLSFSIWGRLGQTWPSLAGPVANQESET